MTKYIITSIIILLSIQVSAQKILVDIFIPSTVLIKNNSGGSSSGVIVGDNSFLYLVTARHCLLNEPQNGEISLVDSLVFLIYYANDAFEGKSDTLLVNLSKALKNRDLLFDPLNDIAILTIAKFDGVTAGGKQSLSYTNSTTKLTKSAPGAMSEEVCLNFNQVDVGEDCTIIGYPSSLQTNSVNDYDFQRPLLRKGAIAGKDKSKRTIIVDCPSYKGNSGGPVFATSMHNNVNTGLIGIVSRSILLGERLESSYYRQTVSINYINSGYTVIIPIEFANALMKIRRSFN